jgi:hypothetical protein
MRSLFVSAGFLVIIGGAGCAGSNEEQRQALVHQRNSDVAAQNGQFGIAADEQRKAAAAHNRAVKKAIAEGKPIPEQTKTGDPVPPDTAH